MSNSFIKFKALQKRTTLLNLVSLRSDVNTEYFLLNSSIFSSFKFLDYLMSIMNIAKTDPIIAVVIIIEKYVDVLVTLSPL